MYIKLNDFLLMILLIINYLFYYFILTEEQKGNYQIKYDILRILYIIS
jgi:hypothetical protein